MATAWAWRPPKGRGYKMAAKNIVVDDLEPVLYDEEVEKAINEVGK